MKLMRRYEGLQGRVLHEVGGQTVPVCKIYKNKYIYNI